MKTTASPPPAPASSYLLPPLALPPGESWQSSPELRRLHLVREGRRHARCGAAPLRWHPPNDYAPLCRTCAAAAAEFATAPPPVMT